MASPPSELAMQLNRLSALRVEEERPLSSSSSRTADLPRALPLPPRHRQPHFNPAVPAFLRYYEEIDDQLSRMFSPATYWSAPSSPPPAPRVPPMKEAVLAEGTVPSADPSWECHVCYEPLVPASTFAQTTCCTTAESVKRMHWKCALHCLRRTDLCPFCKSAKIAFR